jgi:flagellin-like protein
MKAWGSLRHKFRYFLKSAPEGLSPVVGSLLLLLIVFVLVGAVASSVNLSEGRTNFQQPMAKITLESCEGGIYGVGPVSKWVTFKENQIVLIHEGGDSLPLDSISIRISGYGNSFKGNISNGTGKRIEGDVEVLYLDLGQKGKNPKYITRNSAVLEDGSWDVGEKLILCGNDSAIGNIYSSVKVTVGGAEETKDNYGFKAGSEITLMVIDRKGRNVIAERTAIVKLAE